jgi:hypothetical protein
VLSEQQEVSDNGTTLWTYPENPNKPEEYRNAPGSPQGPIPQLPSPASTAPQRRTAPPPTTTAEDRRKQAEAMQACIKKVLTEHPRGGVEQAQAIAACNQAK